MVGGGLGAGSWLDVSGAFERLFELDDGLGDFEHHVALGPVVKHGWARALAVAQLAAGEPLGPRRHGREPRLQPGGHASVHFGSRGLKL